MHAKARWVASAAAALITLGFSGCSASNGSSTAATSSPAPVTSGQSYTSRAFSIPLTIAVPASFFKAQPNSDTSTLLTWFTGSETRFHKVRFLLPDALYRPGQTAPEKPPKDYLTYLRGLSRQGATLADEKKITVDGHSATLMTGTTEHDLDGSIGCPRSEARRTPAGIVSGSGPRPQSESLSSTSAGGRWFLGRVSTRVLPMNPRSLPSMRPCSRASSFAENRNGSQLRAINVPLAPAQTS
jgi:hypothetical protein